MTDLVLVVIVDVLAVPAVAGLLVRVLRRSRTRSASVPGTGVRLTAVASVLLLVALPLPWARATGEGHGLAMLTGSPGSCRLWLAAIVVSVAALGVGCDLGLRGGGLVAAIIAAVIGAGWCLVALDSLLFTRGVNRVAAGGQAHLAAGPAVWCCLLGGLVAVAAGGNAARGSARVAAVHAALPQPPAGVDEWGMPGPSTARETGDQW